MGARWSKVKPRNFLGSMQWRHPEFHCLDRKESDYLIAAQQGMLHPLINHLEQGVGLDTRDSQNRTAAYYAAEHGHINILHELISRNIDLEICGNLPRDDPESPRLRISPLGIACRNGHLECVRLLVHSGAQLHSYATDQESRHGAGSQNVSPMKLAVEKKHTDIIYYLASTPSFSQYRPIMCQHGYIHREISYWTALHFAVNYRHKDNFYRLLRDGFPLNENIVGQMLDFAEPECLEIMIKLIGGWDPSVHFLYPASTRDYIYYLLWLHKEIKAELKLLYLAPHVWWQVVRFLVGHPSTNPPLVQQSHRGSAIRHRRGSPSRMLFHSIPLLVD